MVDAHVARLAAPASPEPFPRFADRVAAQLVAALDLTVEQADGARAMTPAELFTLTAPLRRPCP